MQLLAPFIGSFICCLIDNYPHFLSHKRSECPHCHHQLKLIDLIPIFSYLFLKGKCRYCHAPINPESFIIEILFFIMSIAFHYFSYDNLLIMVLYACLLAIVLIDLKMELIPDSALIILLILFGIKKPITILIIFIIGSILAYKQLIGFGDVKLLIVLVNTISIIEIFRLLFISSSICLIVMLIKKSKRIAYGPFIILGWLLTLIIR